MLEEISDQLEKTFMDEEVNIKNGAGKKIEPDDKIILNVGGVKYETFRSTLTAYPETLLGIMFADRNKEMLHPMNGNEFFFDRDGYLFRHILQYYRTGMIHWPEPSSCHENSTHNTHFDSKKSTKPSDKSEIKDANTVPSYMFPFSRSELEQEMQYFLIPAASEDEDDDDNNSYNPPLTFANKAVVDNVNGFLNSLIDVMHQLAGLFEKHIFITFYHDRQPPIFSLITPNLNVVKNETAPFRENIRKLLLPYAGVGYTLLMNFEREIELYLKGEIPELNWSIEKPAGLPNRFILHLSFNDKFLKQQILRNSCLAKVIYTINSDKSKGHIDN
ncbi:19241_t:CDS:2 [Gigaspora margarita]|uniref:19241_t:CDS:1 n=1 Tax=Gigaspora margarita TaxID=4874 RepID=A0ABN7ULC2_GIGMA|nr:19241_t:CDS:2 [Gigaspora margarita]